MSYISAMLDRKRDAVIVWERDKDGMRVEQIYDAPYYFYTDDPKGKYQTIYDTRVTKHTFDSGREYYGKRKEYVQHGGRNDTKVWESDISPEMRVLSNHYFGVPAPKLHISFCDIENDYDLSIGYATTRNPYAPINAISIFHQHQNRMVSLSVPPDDGINWTPALLEAACEDILAAPTTHKTDYIICKTERELLLHLIEEIKDSDLLVGWNSAAFDFPYIAKRIEKVLGEDSLRYLSFPGAEMPVFKEVPGKYGDVLTVVTSGRAIADYMELYRKYEPGEKASYKLASIEQEVGLGLPKLEYEGNLAELYVKDFAYFVRYNIRDSEILNGFEKKLGYVELANQMYHMSCGLFPHVMGTLKLAELAIVNFCHHELKRVVKNVTEPEIDRQIEGALVLLPQVGMHDYVGSIDINSLYPSAIRSINISPETIRGQFINDVADANEIANSGSKEITLRLENKEEFTATGAEWREWLLERRWAISGYGTVFDQTKPGIIPTILADWYAQRKKYQALKKEASAAGDDETSAYYDRLQYVFKIKLNSLYGALTNLYFRFYDLRMGESTTGTGRAILRHQCRKVSEIVDGKYDVDFPMYTTVKEALEKGHPAEVALYGPVFNGQFQSESVIYGDTDSTYFLTHAETKEQSIIIADEIAAQVNASYKQFMKDKFLCTGEFDDIIKCGREVVADHGIFVGKKLYILHLVDVEGKAVDKMKVMGLSIKKTTLPAAVSSRIEGFVERLLKGEDWKDISHSIINYKDELRGSANIMDIGLPKGVNGVEEYTREYAIYGESTKMSGHGAAAVFYNMLLDQYNDKTSPKIMSGMKIKVFYVKGNYGKFKSVAIPTDINVVPQWFLDNFRIDYDAHILRLIDRPLDNILKAIDKPVPTKQSMLVDSFLIF
jgi:DNA polymerase elongation subunit (family B)